MERTILPEIAEKDFGIAAKTAILSFIVVFGITKALSNYFTGRMANVLGRKNLLTIGWLFALPIPFILIYADSWTWVIFANVLLGINQGLAWSSTVVMKIELVGEKNRGLAMGLNESAGYLAVGIMAFLSGWIAAEYGLRPYPFYLGIGLSVAGFLGSWLLIRDTKGHAQSEGTTSNVPKLEHVFIETTWKNNNLSSITQAGLINNLNDGMVWGLLPMLLIDRSFSLEQTGWIVAAYPIIWGVGQLGTGKLADIWPARPMLFIGMLLQAIVLAGMAIAETFSVFILLSVALGIGTALVYPTFLTAMARYTHPFQRPESIGVFRLWRDLGYAFGALLSGVIADAFGIEAAIYTIASLTLFSAFIIRLRMDK